MAYEAMTFEEWAAIEQSVLDGMQEETQAAVTMGRFASRQFPSRKHLEVLENDLALIEAQQQLRLEE